MYKVHIHVSPVYHYVYEDEHERLCTTLLLLSRLLRFWASAEEEANGCALEAECLTQLIFQVAFVGEMQLRLWTARRCENNKGWRTGAGLRHVEDPQRIFGRGSCSRLFEVPLKETVQL